MKHTPDFIERLEPNQIFVFGSNLAGNHVGGAARRARVSFGAEEGIGEGFTGKCYAFPTLDKTFQKRSIMNLKLSRDRFLKEAEALPVYEFVLTRVGCGIAGYDEKDMIALFKDCPGNVVKPEGW